MIDHADTTKPNVPKKMDPEAKATWLEALRSGKFEQTTGKLQDDNGCNCCLGVLVRVQGLEIQDRGYGNAFNFGKVDAHEENIDFVSNYCPPDNYCGLAPGDQSYLVDMNDLKKKSFAEIADYIEANL